MNEPRFNELSEQTMPWYRYGWPWFLISIPFVSIVLGCLMLYLALNANNSMVVDDYYKQGKAINLRIERDRAATLLGLGVTVQSSSEGVILELSQEAPALPAELQVQARQILSAFSTPDSLKLRWVHVTQQAHDGSALLQSVGGNRYVGVGVQLPDNGKFRLHVQPENSSTWRLVSGLTGLAAELPVTISARQPDEVFRQSAFE